MAEHSFQLRVVKGKASDYGLALYQEPQNGSRRKKRKDAGNDDWRLVAKVNGTPMRSVIDQILGAIKQAGYRASDLSRGREEPFSLKEETGVRLGLLFLAVKPLRKQTRMSDISDHIAGMTDEEAYYWFSKTTSVHDGRRAQKALRILLAKE